MSVEQTLRTLANDTYPFHMPGHKRNPAFAFCEHPIALDTTEVTGSDNLHDAHGILADSMALAARLVGARRSFLLVGGATAGLLAGISASVRRGDTVLVARNCHRAVAHALALAGVHPVWLQPEWNASLGVYGALSPDTVRQALTAHPEATLTIVTSPTYEGVTSDITAIADTVHATGGLLLVDEAHGAHFGYAKDFPPSAVTLGADIVVQSLHKTLPAPTQTALLHACSSRTDAARLARQLAVFQTSSPSYLLMAGIDNCLRLLDREADALVAAYSKRLTAFRRRVGSLVLSPNADSGKLIIPCENGATLADRLRTEFRLETEMSGAHHVLAMTSIADTDEGFDRLATALTAIAPAPSTESIPCPPAPEIVCTPAEAADADRQWMPLTEAVGRIIAEECYAYPPGIPLAVPGERVTDALVAHVQALQNAGVEILGIADEKIAVIA